MIITSKQGFYDIKQTYLRTLWRPPIFKWIHVWILIMHFKYLCCNCCAEEKKAWREYDEKMLIQKRSKKKYNVSI